LGKKKKRRVLKGTRGKKTQTVRKNLQGGLSYYTRVKNLGEKMGKGLKKKVVQNTLACRAQG